MSIERCHPDLINETRLCVTWDLGCGYGSFICAVYLVVSNYSP